MIHIFKLLFVARKYTKRVSSSHLLTEPNQHILGSTYLNNEKNWFFFVIFFIEASKWNVEKKAIDSSLMRKLY